jgi:hypothetical protein
MLAHAVLMTLALGLGSALADDPPNIDHQAIPCTIPDKPISICANVTDDVQVAKARVFFRRAGDKYFSYVDMVFGGINYCATLPAPREGKAKELDYYVRAFDNQYHEQSTSTFRMTVQPESLCKFPPIESDPARAASIVVHGTDQKQGKKLPDAFDPQGVRYIPAAGK